MTFKLNRNDLKLLSSIAEYQVLTLSQVAALQLRSRQVVRRRIRDLEQEGLIVSDTMEHGQSRGRPEKILSLTEMGGQMLRSHWPDLRDIPLSRLTSEKLRCLNHQLMVNWFRIHLGHIENIVPHLSVHFLSPNSPYVQQGPEDRPLIFEPSPGAGQGRNSRGFTPDGVLSLVNNEKQKALLFFLEVDMGTESLASPQRDFRDVRQKVVNYKGYFRSGQYKRYEKTWNRIFNGFRLLFLVNTSSRLASLCRLVQEMPPSDFIWLTDMGQVFSRGLSERIWAHGGRQEMPAGSILGPEMACRAPILPLKP